MSNVILPWADPSQLLRGVPLPAEPVGTRRKVPYKRLDPDRYKADRAAAQGEAFVTLCNAHGESLFDTATGGCLICEASVAASGLPAVRVAEIIGADHYYGTCEEHGRALHHLGSEQCKPCSAGKVGRPGDPARVAARRSGASSYLARCETHGEVPHHTMRGRCLSCFNTLGQPRKGPALR